MSVWDKAPEVNRTKAMVWSVDEYGADSGKYKTKIKQIMSLDWLSAQKALAAIAKAVGESPKIFCDLVASKLSVLKRVKGEERRLGMGLLKELRSILDFEPTPEPEVSTLDMEGIPVEVRSTAASVEIRGFLPEWERFDQEKAAETVDTYLRAAYSYSADSGFAKVVKNILDEGYDLGHAGKLLRDGGEWYLSLPAGAVDKEQECAVRFVRDFILSALEENKESS